VLEELAEELDVTGIERVRHALYAHHWPNLKAKCKLFKLYINFIKLFAF